METFNPHKGQLTVIKDNSRWRLVNCGRRWGKTTLAVNEMLAYASLRPNSLVVYFAPTFAQARDIAWRMLKRTALQYGTISGVNETRLEIRVNNSEIWLRGVENYESARGLGIHFLVVDEIAMMRNWYHIWEEVLYATTRDTAGQGLFCSTPKGYNHWWDMWDKGQRGEDEYKSWTFPSSDNPYLPREELEKAKTQLRREAYEQEYMAMFRSTVGLAHPQFDRFIHLLEPFDTPREWQRGRGFDFGSAHPTASIRTISDSDDNWFIDSYYKIAGRTIEEHAHAIQQQDYGMGAIPVWGDPSGGQWFTEFSQHNLNILPASREIKTSARNWVEFCVESVNERLKKTPGHTVMLPTGQKIEDAPRLFFLKNQGWEKCIYEIENLKWKESKDASQTPEGGGLLPTLDENLDKEGHFDLMAALRYFAVSYNRVVDKYVPPKDDVSNKNWALK